MSLSVRMSGRYTPVGLVLLVAILGAFAVWTESATREAVSQAHMSAQNAVAYRDARFALTMELATQREYRLGHDADLPGKFQRQVLAFRTALAALPREGITQNLARQYSRYRSGSYRFMRLVRAGNVAAARQTDDNVVEPLYNSMLSELVRGASEQDLESRAQLDALHAVQNRLELATVVVFSIGLMWLLAIFSALQVYRRRVNDEAARARESEVRFQAIFEGAALAINLVDPEGAILQCNTAYAHMLGYSAEELLAVHFREFTHPDDVEADLALHEELLQGQRDHYQLEKRYVHRNGTPVWVHLTVSLLPVRGHMGRCAIGMAEDITARKQVEADLHYQALHDPLTGLPNRALLLDRLEQVTRASQRDGRPAALLLMDLDRFKEINDTFGHQLGDALLQELPERLQSALRAMDTVARLGGDEIAILLPDTDVAGAEAAARRVLAALAEPFTAGAYTLDVEASIGIAVCPDHGDDPHELMRRADVAMYLAKREQLGFACYVADHDQHSPRRMALVRDLRQAIARDELTLHYQPKRDLREGRITGVEALARWIHPEYGPVSPAEFIPLAERTGLIKPLGFWSLQTAMEHCRALHDRGMPQTVAVNVSAILLHDQDLVDMIARLVQRTQVAPGWLMLEITESAVMAHSDRALVVLRRLHDMGVRLSIDDFGSGYSSLGYLKLLPVDQVKIDKSFVLDMAVRRDSASIVRAVIDLGHNLGLEVVAEGVENQVTMDMLARMGCDLVQGFHLARPMDVDALMPWLEGQPWRVIENERTGPETQISSIIEAR